MTHRLGEDRLTIGLVARASTGDLPIIIPPAAWDRIATSEAIVAAHAASGSPVYGLNTGLGGNLGTRIPREQVLLYFVKFANLVKSEKVVQSCVKVL